MTDRIPNLKIERIDNENGAGLMVLNERVAYLALYLANHPYHKHPDLLHEMTYAPGDGWPFSRGL